MKFQVFNFMLFVARKIFYGCFYPRLMLQRLRKLTIDLITADAHTLFQVKGFEKESN